MDRCDQALQLSQSGHSFQQCHLLACCHIKTMYCVLCLLSDRSHPYGNQIGCLCCYFLDMVQCERCFDCFQASTCLSSSLLLLQPSWLDSCSFRNFLLTCSAQQHRQYGSQVQHQCCIWLVPLLGCCFSKTKLLQDKHGISYFAHT